MAAKWWELYIGMRLFVTQSDLKGVFHLIGFLKMITVQEKKLCDEIRILPSHYLKMQQTISLEISKGSVTKKSDAHKFFKVEPSKVDRIYDMLVKKGILQT